jgi:hypothetical protein
MEKLKQKSSQKSSSTSYSATDSPLSEKSYFPDISLQIQEVKDSVSEIYREYLKDLKTRRDKRLSLKVPTSDAQLYNLVINPKYRVSLKSKIKDLIQSDYTHRLKDTIESILENFITDLKDFINDCQNKSRLLQVVYLHETFHSLQNSIGEISKILTDLYPYNEFCVINYKKFHFGVISGCKKIVNLARSQDSSHFAVASVIKMCDEIEKSIQTGECKSKEMMFEMLNDAEETSDEPVHSLPLEDVVNYINGSPLGRKEKRTIRKNCESSEMDLEVNEFEKRLAGFGPLRSRESPCCSVDFLNVLRSRYLEVRKKLLSN